MVGGRRLIGGRGAGNGSGDATRLDAPSGVCIDSSSGDVYIVDEASATIWKRAMNTLTLVAGRPYLPGIADGVIGVSQLTTPRSCVVIGGALDVSDSLANTVRKLDLSSGTLTTFAGLANIYGLSDGPKGPGGSASRAGSPAREARCTSPTPTTGSFAA